jgi:HlyD family secretion protein
LDLASVQGQVDQAKAALAVAAAGLPGQSDLAAAREAVQSAQSAASAAKAAVQHYQQLYSQGAATQAELAAKQADYSTAQASLQSAKQNLSELQGGKAAKVAQAQYDQAKTAYQAALETLNQGHLKAPQSGTVLRIAPAEGDFLQPGMLIMVIGSADQVQVTADLNEQDVGGVAAGQTAEIQWAGAVGTTFRGSVLLVSPSITASTINPTDNVAHVTISVDNAQGKLKPGATVDAIIYRVQPRQALQVPNEALAGSSGSRYVFVVDGKIAKKRAVTVGYSNELFTEIKSGLQQNDLVVLNPGSLKDGQKVNLNGGAGK